MTTPAKPAPGARAPGLLSLLRPYRGWVGALVGLTMLANGLNLLVPKLVADAIDSFGGGSFSLAATVRDFLLVTLGIAVLTYLQALVQTLTSERVARDLRTRLAARLSEQDYAFVQQAGAATLLTNLTSDIDAIKTFVSQAIASIVSSLFLIVGAAILLLLIDWQLGLLVLLVVPIVGATFYVVLSRVRKLFRKSQAAIDWLNKVITESIIGSALIRLLNSQAWEHEKFRAANTEARSIGMSILRLFSALVPAISFAVNLALLAILAFGGHLVIGGAMSLGDFSAFLTYLSILIFPIIIIGFMSTVIGQASASHGRVSKVLAAPLPAPGGALDVPLRGDIAVRDLTVTYDERPALREVSFSVPAGTRTAIIGPTAAGKTQLLYALAGLFEPDSGEVFVDGRPIGAYDRKALHRQIGFVFQESALFNLTLRENIAFSTAVRDAALAKAIATAELGDFIAGLPQGLDTVVSERGTSLSGGQKQRIMLARALALDPRVLLLDDFTARVDAVTERKILTNIGTNYPDITLISVTQKIAPVEGYDQIVLLMEGQVLAVGTHAALLATSPEYVQIYSSQQSTEDYALQA